MVLQRKKWKKIHLEENINGCYENKNSKILPGGTRRGVEGEELILENKNDSGENYWQNSLKIDLDLV
jgi:hypothetical protein